MDPGQVIEQPRARIEVRRPLGGSSRLRAFHIFVDGIDAGELRRNESLEVEVDPGTHKVQARIDWTQSRVLPVELAPGDVAELVCRTRWSDLLLAFWVITFGRNNYPHLERAA